MTRIAILTLSLSRNAGGLFSSVRRLTQSCQRNAYQFKVLGPEDEFSAQDLVEWQPLEAVAYPTTGPKAVGYCRSLARSVAQFDPQLIHQHGIWMYYSRIAHSQSRKTACPVMISPRGMLDPWALQQSRFKKLVAWHLFERRNLRDAACLHALCDSERDAMRQLGLKNPVCVIPNGVDLPTIKHQQHSDTLQILFLGRIHPKKGISSLVEAMARLKATKILPLRLIVAGWDDGGHLQGLRQMSDQLGVRWRDLPNQGDLELSALEMDTNTALEIVYVGPAFDERKTQLLQQADAFILPSHSEGLPMSVLEAWSHEVPVLMSPACNLPVGFDRGCAIEVHPNAESIAEGIRRFSQMPTPQRNELGRNGRRLVEEQFTWESVARRQADVYRWMLQGGSPAACVS